MLARSVRNPLIIGVGTGLVLVSGTAPAALAATTPTPTPSPSATTTAPASSSPSATPTTTNSPSSTPTTSKPTTPDPSAPPPPPPPINVKIERLSKGAVHAGSVVKFNAHIAAQSAVMHSVRLSLGSTPKADIDMKCVISAGLCELGDVDTATGKDVEFTLTVSSKTTSGTIRVEAEAVSGPDQADSGQMRYALKVTKAPKPTPSPTHSSGSSSGSSGSSGSNLPTGNLGSSGVPSATPSNGSAVLPPITTPQQAPATAPNAQNPSDSPQMRGTAADADELTFGELASTQAAWLAALLVAFSLLLTQVRLGRAGTKDPKQKGAHRRPRRPGNAH